MFDCIVNFFGTLFIYLLIIYLVLLVIARCKKDQLNSANSQINMGNMPVMRPIPIPTANQRGFLNKLLIFVFQVRRWRVEQAFIYHHQGKRYAIHAGFEFDGASVPKILWALLSPVGLLLVPGLIHDYGYRYNGIYLLNENDELEWSEAINDQAGWDKLFKQIGNEVNKMPLLNELAQFGLWLGGFKAWNTWRDKKEPKPEFKWQISEQESAPDDNQENSPVDQKNSVIDETENASGDNSQPFTSGKTKTTQVGYINPNNQKVHGTRGTKGTDNNQVAYKVECLHCSAIYGANGSEIYRRKCPDCQGGKAGIEF